MFNISRGMVYQLWSGEPTVMKYAMEACGKGKKDKADKEACEKKSEELEEGIPDKYYSQPAVLDKGSEAYKNLESAARIFEKKSPGISFKVQDTYFDFGQGWKWTTIIADKRGDIWQALNPRDWEEIVNGCADSAIEGIADEHIKEYPMLYKTTVYGRNEGLHEDVFKEWKPNLNFKHIKDVLDKAIARGSYVNNERDEVMAALDKADKGGYTPEQRKFIRDKHQEMWKKGRSVKTEGFNKAEAIIAVQDAYGFNKREAINYIKKASEEQIQALIDGFRDNAKRSFLDDSLKESKTPWFLKHFRKEFKALKKGMTELGYTVDDYRFSIFNNSNRLKVTLLPFDRINMSDEDKIVSIMDRALSPVNGKVTDVTPMRIEVRFNDSTELIEDTVKKSNGKWTNRGDDGKEHGEFKTKKAADAQRRAMYANGFKG